ncbi:MAG: AAA family ATPase [Polyangiales bacterium]
MTATAASMPIRRSAGIHLCNFRGFRSAHLELRALTMLMGPNNAGKSSFIHSLVALHQVHISRTGVPRLDLIRHPIDLGSANDLRFSCNDGAAAGEITVSFSFDIEGRSSGVTFGFGSPDYATSGLELTSVVLSDMVDRDAVAETVAVSTIDLQTQPISAAPLAVAATQPADAPAITALRRISSEIWTSEVGSLRVGFKGLVPAFLNDPGMGRPHVADLVAAEFAGRLLDGIRYLAADRPHPRRVYAVHTDDGLGAGGENVAAYLRSHANDIVSYCYVPHAPCNLADAVRAIDEPFSMRTASLIDALGEWMLRIGLAERIEVTTVPNGITMSAGVCGLLRNVADLGYGVAQVIPIVVAGLALKEHETLVVENPESQLHPRAQAGLADFLWGLAMSGRRVIVESHGEAMFHRLRLRAALHPQLCRDLGVWCFDGPTANGALQEPRQVDLLAKEVDWPENFLMEAVAEETSIRQAHAARRTR